MDKLRQCYETLGISPGSTWEEIKQAYKDSVKVWHPDRFENDPRLKQKAIEKIKEINAAYEKLSNFFGEYGAPNFASTSYQQEEQSHKENKDFETDPLGRTEHSEDDHTQSHDINTDTQLHVGRPWRRYWARTLDTLLLTLPVSFVFGLVFPEFTANTLKSGGELVIGIFILPFVMLCEACILGGTGTTFGKWLLNIKLIRKEDGGSITFSNALMRSILVWVKGLAFGLPLICLFSMGFAAGRIRKNRTASWDDSISADVQCGKLHSGKLSLYLISIIIIFIIYGALQTASKNSNSRTSSPAAQSYLPAPSPATLNSEVNNNYNNPNSIRFIVQDNCNDGISIQYRFFDLTNNLWWPSSEQVYTTIQYKIPITHNLSCSANSIICFGASTYTTSPTVFWGLGINKEQQTNIETSCVSCGSVHEKILNFACPPKNEYTQQTHINSLASSNKRTKSVANMYDPPQPTGNTKTTTTTRQGYRGYNTDNGDMRETTPQPERKIIEFSDLSPSQKQSLELACFEAKVKGNYHFNECIKSKLSAYK